MWRLPRAAILASTRPPAMCAWLTPPLRRVCARRRRGLQRVCKSRQADWRMVKKPAQAWPCAGFFISSPGQDYCLPVTWETTINCGMNTTFYVWYVMLPHQHAKPHGKHLSRFEDKIQQSDLVQARGHRIAKSSACFVRGAQRRSQHPLGVVARRSAAARLTRRALLSFVSDA